MAEAHAKEGALASHGKRRKKKERRKEHKNRKKRTHQQGEIYHYVDHGGEWQDKLAKEASAPTTWHDI